MKDFNKDKKKKKVRFTRGRSGFEPQRKHLLTSTQKAALALCMKVMRK